MMPPGTSQPRTREFMRDVSGKLKQNPAVHSVFEVTGFSFIGSGESVGMFFIKLKDYGERDMTATDFIGWANGMAFMQTRDGMAFFANFPTIAGLGAFGGFDFWLEDRRAQGRQALYGAMGGLLGKATQNNPSIGSMQPNELPPAPQLKVKVDRTQAESMGLSISDVYTGLQLMLAPVYVNDFMYEGRVLRVTMQADAAFRRSEESFSRFYVPAGNTGTTNRFSFAGDTASDGMVPLSAVLRSQWTVAPPAQARFNGFPAVNLNGTPAAGKSSGEAMAEVERIVNTDLPGFGFDWAGQSFQERLSGSEAPMLFALSILVVFLCLAALYESWVTPIAVLLIVPVGIIGSVIAAKIGGMNNDVFFKVGLITIIGLSAKNAILIVEFALEEQKRGKDLYESVIEAARLRLRPILMTSFAFILGVLPLLFASGAGANARRALGTGVVGGMLSAAVLGVLLAPLFYVVIRKMAGDKLNLNHD